MPFQGGLLNDCFETRIHFGVGFGHDSGVSWDVVGEDVVCCCCGVVLCSRRFVSGNGRSGLLLKVAINFGGINFGGIEVAAWS